MPDLYSYCHDDEQIKNMIIRQDYKIKWHYQKEMIYYLLLQGLVCFGPTSGHCVKVPEAAEKCSQPQGFPPWMINTLAFERMINTLTIWSYDQYTVHCYRSSCDLPPGKMYQQVIWMGKTFIIWYYHIMMCDTSLCDEARIESICDKNK